MFLFDIKDYLNVGFVKINKRLRETGEKVDPAVIEGLPKVTSLWRGQPTCYLLNEIRGNVFTGWSWSPKGVTSTSRSYGIARYFRPKEGALIYLHDIQGYDVSIDDYYKKEQEAIVLPGKTYHIKYLIKLDVYVAATNANKLQEGIKYVQSCGYNFSPIVED